MVLCLGFSDNYNADSLDRFRKSMVDKVKLYMSILMRQKHPNKQKIKIKYANEFIVKNGLVDPSTGAYQFMQHICSMRDN